MKTKKLLTLVASSALLVLAGCANDTIATSKHGNVTKEEMYNLLKKSQGSQALYSLLIEKVALGTIKDKSGIEEAVTKFIADRETSAGGKEAFEKLLKTNGFNSIDEFKKAVYNDRVTAQVIKENITVTDEEITAAYETYVPKMTASHILVSDENLANDIINQLKNGVDFSALAAQHSIDTASKNAGGSLGGPFDPSKMVPEFATAAKAMKNGEISATPVKTQYGFHIIKMENNPPAKGTLEQEKETIKAELIAIKAADTTVRNEIMTKLLQEANVQISDAHLSEALSTILNPSTTAGN